MTTKITVVAGPDITDFVSSTVVSAQIGANQAAVFVIKIPETQADGVLRVTSVPGHQKLAVLISDKQPTPGQLANAWGWKSADIARGLYKDSLPIAFGEPHAWMFIDANATGDTSGVEKDKFDQFVLHAKHTDTWFLSVVALNAQEELTINVQGKIEAPRVKQ